MNLNKAFSLRVEDRAPKWRLVDAAGATLGRLATEIANALRGKDKVTYTPHSDAGDYVVVINCEKVKLTGQKMNQKIYWRHSGYQGGRKEISIREMLTRNPAYIIEHAVKGMVPKGPQGRKIMGKLKVYAGPSHDHQAQISK